jgi:hypothetical protein
MKITGVLNVWFPERNYGFLHEQRDGLLVSHFLHAANIVSGKPRSGAMVTFQSVMSTKGSLAMNAEILDVKS